MTFGLPNCLYALALIPALLAIFILNQKRARVLLQKLLAARLVEQLAGSVSRARRWLRFLFQLAALALFIFALARPRYGYTWEENKSKGRDVLIAIDVSKSMLSTDVSPNRLTRAKLAAQDLVGLLPGDRVGVIAFAGDAFLQAPLTADAGAVLDSIRELDTNIIPVGGTNIAEAIKIAADAFGKGESDNRALVLFSDGEEIEADGVAAARANADNFRIFTVGVGTTGGSLIPLVNDPSGANFVKDERGQFVKSRLDPERLQKLAEVSGGFYVHLENGPTDMRRIVNEGLHKLSEREIDAKMSRHAIERYQWPLGFGMVLLIVSLLISERKRAPHPAKNARAFATATVAFFVCFSPFAFGKTSGVELYKKGDFKAAMDAFEKIKKRRGENPALEFNLGASAYQLGDFDKALDAFSRALTTREPGLQAKAEYNIGNTLFRRGFGKSEADAKLKEWRGAIEHYEQALKIDPKNEDAKSNRDRVKKLIEDLEKQKKEEQQKQQQDKKNQQKKEDQQQQGGQSEQQNQNGKSKEDQQQQNQKAQNQQQSKDGGEKSQSQSQSDEQKNQDGDKSGEMKFGDKNSSQSPPQNQQAKNEGAPPPGSDKKFEGQIQAAQPEKPNANEPPTQQAFDAAEAQVKDGEMSKNQALMLLESAKDEDKRVNLTEHKRAMRVTKDW